MCEMRQFNSAFIFEEAKDSRIESIRLPSVSLAAATHNIFKMQYSSVNAVDAATAKNALSLSNAYR